MVAGVVIIVVTVCIRKKSQVGEENLVIKSVNKIVSTNDPMNSTDSQDGANKNEDSHTDYSDNHVIVPQTEESVLGKGLFEDLSGMV